MHEIELKLQVPPARRDAVRREVAGRQAGAPLRLQAAYFDTPERTLAAAGLALRLRREGRRWVQALKGAGPDGMTRLEHEVPRGSAAAMPVLDPALHAGTPVGTRLAEVLAAPDHGPLACAWRTDIRRTHRRVRVGAASVELAFDEGRIVAGDRRLPVCELEIESVAGAPAAVIAAARRWIERHHLWIDLRSKAERGDLLARGLESAPERKAQPVRLDPAMSVAQARRAVVACCLDQIAVNASSVASGRYDDGHVHQLRVGLRRMRSAWRLFDGLGAPAAHDEAGEVEAAATLFRALGAARDLAAVGGPLRIELQHALGSVGLALEAPAVPAATDAPEPTQAVRAAPAQVLLLDLFAAAQAPADDRPADEAPLRELLARRLNRWHRRIAADAKTFAELDDVARHRLRKRVKRLRYAVEFVAALFGDRAVRRYVEPLRELQERLGALSDVLVGLQAFRAAGAADDARTLFALGWLAARRETLIAEVGPALKRFAKARRFWK